MEVVFSLLPENIKLMNETAVAEREKRRDERAEKVLQRMSPQRNAHGGRSGINSEHRQIAVLIQNLESTLAAAEHNRAMQENYWFDGPQTPSPADRAPPR